MDVKGRWESYSTRKILTIDKHVPQSRLGASSGWDRNNHDIYRRMQEAQELESRGSGLLLIRERVKYLEG